MNSAKIPVGLGVDGSASNDSNHLLLEARQALLYQRANAGAEAFSARQALWHATRGGAAVLGWPECGQLSKDARADFAIWDVSTVEFAGAWDPVAALILTGPHQAQAVYVEGEAIVEDGTLVSFDETDILQRARNALQRLMLQ